MRLAPRLIAALLALAAGSAAASDTAARPRIVLVTTAWEPYIGERLPGKGYVFQLVSTAFARAGVDVDIRFYPWARALALAREGKAAGLLPEYFDARRENEFVYSQPFPGGPVGFCARRDRAIRLPASLTAHPAEALAQLRGYRFGVVRGYLNAPAFDAATDLTRDEARNDETNLRKLIRGRVDLAVIDRYVARYLLRTVFAAEQAQVECLEPPLAQQSLYVGFSLREPRHAEYLDAFNRGLAQVGAAAELADIMRRTGLDSATAGH